MRRYRKTEADDELSQLRQGKINPSMAMPPPTSNRIVDSNPILSSHFDQEASLQFNPMDAPVLRDISQMQREYQEDDEAIGAYVFKMPGVQTTSCTRLTSTVLDDVADPDVEATVHLPASTFTSNVKRSQSSFGASVPSAASLVTSATIRLSEAPPLRRTSLAKAKLPQQANNNVGSGKGTASTIFGRDIYGKAKPAPQTQSHPQQQSRPTTTTLNLRQPSDDSLVVRTSYAPSGGAITFCTCGRCVDLTTSAVDQGEGVLCCPHCGASLRGTAVKIHDESPDKKQPATVTKADPNEAAALLREIEAREAEEFKKAVAEWRRGGTDGGDVVEDTPIITTSPTAEVKVTAQHSISVGSSSPAAAAISKGAKRGFPIPRPTYFSHLWSCVDSN